MMFTLAACGELADEPLVPDPESVETIDVDPEIGSIKQASQTWPAPRQIMLFPENQGGWLGEGNGQLATAPFSLYGGEVAYGYDDDRINISRNIFVAPSQCQRLSQGSMRCGGTTYTCPAQACTTTYPAMWRAENGSPDRWGWFNGSDAPGNHGWRPGYRARGTVMRQCNDGPPSLNVFSEPFGGILDCSYPMPVYSLVNF